MKKSSFKALYSPGLVYIHILLWLTIFIYLNYSATLKEPVFKYNNNREFVVELQRCIDYHHQYSLYSLPLDMDNVILCQGQHLYRSLQRIEDFIPTEHGRNSRVVSGDAHGNVYL